MKPTLSIIVFTISSGAGLGLLMLLVLLHEFPVAQPFAIRTRVATGSLALALVIIGLIASTFHLANPRNAWKAFSRFRSSWLSREAVFAVLLLPTAIVYLLGIAFGGGARPLASGLLGTLVLLLALATLFSTSMIYASLKPIRQWHDPTVPASYVVLGLATGGLLLTAAAALAGAEGSATPAVTLGLLAAGAAVKAVYYRRIGRAVGPTIQSATGITRARVRLQDLGHSHESFLTREFGNRLHRLSPRSLRALVFALGFLLPAVFILVAQLGAGPIPTLLAVPTAFAGLFVERWLFFVEARHTVNLYHGAQRT